MPTFRYRATTIVLPTALAICAVLFGCSTPSDPTPTVSPSATTSGTAETSATASHDVPSAPAIGPASSSADGASAGGQPPVAVVDSMPDGDPATVATGSSGASAVPDAGDGLGDQRIYSIAIETYIRSLPDKNGRTIGYLRAGGSLRRSDEPVGTNGCKGGWYAVEPEGFVCNGPDATLDPAARIVMYAQPGPKRGEPVPYTYAYVREKVPYYYARLPDKKDRGRIEGGDVEGSIAAAFQSPDPRLGLLGPAIEVPQDLLDGGRIPRPPGVAPRLRFAFHTGRAEPRTRLALMSWFEHDKRRWAITSQLDLVAIDRLRLVDPPAFRGVEIAEGQALPVGFAKQQNATGYRFDEEGKPTETVRLTHRQGFHLTGEKRVHAGKTLLASHEGIWVQENALIMVEPRETPSFVKNDTLRWLDISIRNQTLVAYRGKQAVYATLVSTGRGAMGDPATTHATPRGLFSVFSKHVSTKMSGDEIGSEYQIDDVPYVQYFHRGYALHTAFWHDNFGRVQSHGCVNLAPADAAWVFEFTGPEVPNGWHGRYVKSGGTPILIRP